MNRKIQSPPFPPDSFTAEEGKTAVKKMIERLDDKVKARKRQFKDAKLLRAKLARGA